MRTNSLVSLIALAAVASGCGLMQMPDKMDATLTEIRQTNQQLRDTNTNTGKLISGTDRLGSNTVTLVHGTDSLAGKTDQLATKMDVTNGYLSQTKQTIHQQTLAVALDAMMKDYNTTYMYPTPIAMFAAAKVFGEEVRSDELAELAYATLKDIDESDLAPDADPNAAPEEPSRLAARVRELNEYKSKRLNSLMAIAGMTPQSTIERVIADQVTANGPYRTATLALLLLRANCLRDVLLSMVEGTVTDLGALELGVERTGYLDSLARLPFADEIALRTIGFKAPAQNRDERLDRGAVTMKWKKLRRAVKSVGEARALSAAETARLEAARARIEAALAAPAADH